VARAGESRRVPRRSVVDDRRVEDLVRAARSARPHLPSCSPSEPAYLSHRLLHREEATNSATPGPAQVRAGSRRGSSPLRIEWCANSRMTVSSGMGQDPLRNRSSRALSSGPSGCAYSQGRVRRGPPEGYAEQSTCLRGRIHGLRSLRREEPNHFWRGTATRERLPAGSQRTACASA
jgi:hypothetical protein